jgi:uncharacterized protein YjiS (DUF1127 family)
MTMSTSIPSAIDLSTAGSAWKRLADRVAAALRAAQARHEARRAYRSLLECDDDHLLRDVGVTRGDVRGDARARRPELKADHPCPAAR